MFPLHGSGHSYSGLPSDTVGACLQFLIPVCSDCCPSCPEPDSSPVILEPFFCVSIQLECGWIVALNAVSLLASRSALQHRLPASTCTVQPRVTSSTLTHTWESMVIFWRYTWAVQFTLFSYSESLSARLQVYMLIYYHLYSCGNSCIYRTSPST